MSEEIPRTFTTSYEKRKQLFEYIKVLVRPEQEHILKILKKFKENYTENSNGIFFDLMGICDITFEAIEEYLSFCLKNREEDKERITEMDKLRNENYVSSDDSSNDNSDDDNEKTA
jgi:hypothetical protein